MKKIVVGVMYGGRSVEHEVSVRSAKNIIAALDRQKYKAVSIFVSKKGKLDQKLLKKVDIVFPIIHGTYGEDGTLQGFLKTLDMPFVGADVLGSAVGMDKEVAKRLLRDAGLPIGRFETIRRGDKISFTTLKKKLSSPLFVKPANAGSSVGVHKVNSEKEFKAALADAFQYDHKLLAEEFIRGREIECSVLGNDKPIASAPGEVVSHHEFYSYEAKYLDEHGAELNIPARLPSVIRKKIQRLAIQTYQVLCCAGMARVDFFLTKSGKVMVNEINTLPGFTNISMYPKLWQVSGIGYTELITRLIELALSRAQQDKKLNLSYVQRKHTR